MLRTIKPKNARSKRALTAREPQIEENEKTAIFVRGEKISEFVKVAMKDLHALKAPHGINFSKKNPIHPFSSGSASSSSSSTTATSSSTDAQSLQSLSFFSQKNDASLFVVGTHSKKRPHGLVFGRCFDGQVMDMIEVGLEGVVGMNEIKTAKSTPGHRFLMTFHSPLFTTHPSFMLLKSILLDFFNGHEVSEIPLMGLESVMSVTAGPLEGQQESGPDVMKDIMEGEGSGEKLPSVHIRVYTMKLLNSGTRLPKLALEEMGPRLDFRLRRQMPADPTILSHALRRPKLEKKKVEAGQGKKRKNIETDEMGDLRATIHLGKQDLSSLQGRKMKGLRDPEKRNGSGAKKQKRVEAKEVDAGAADMEE